MADNNSLSNKMDSTNIVPPSKELVTKYEKLQKNSWWTRFVTSVDTWHRWVDLGLKVCVSATIVILLWRWISFVMSVISSIEPIRPSATVQISLVTGTSVNLIGLLAIMAKYLFPDTKKK